MGYGVFNAVGTVRSVSERQTQAGAEGRAVLMQLGVEEWGGQVREVMLEASAWGKAAEQAASARPGQTVAVSGTVECRQSERGYWNPRLRVREVVVLPARQAQPQQAQGPLDQDIPF